MPEEARDQTLAAGRFLRLVSRQGWEFVERCGASGVVGIVAVTDDRRLLLVEQFRPPTACSVIELPAGLAGDIRGQELEDLETAARRELLEETGYAADELTYLATGPSSAGLTNETVALFLAEGLRQESSGGGNDSENITVHAIRFDDVATWLRARAGEGALIDLKIYAALYFISGLAANRETG
jgi:ADP-ribose pyrophosphatase